MKIRFFAMTVMPSAKQHLPRRRISRRLFLHVAREFLIPFFCALLAFAFLFMINNIFDDLPDFMGSEAPISDILLYFLALQPHNLLNVVPVSVLLAASFMTVMLGRNNELCAMRAAGLSLATCALPLWIVSIIAALCVAGISESWGQSSNDYANSLRRRWVDKKKKKKIQPVALANSQQHRDWFLTPSEGTNTFTQVVMRQHADDNVTPVFIIAAQSVSVQGNNWTFLNGTRQDFSPEGTPQTAVPFQSVTLALEENPNDFSVSRNALDVISTRSALALLNRDIPPPAKTAHKLRVIIWYNLTFPLASVVAALFGFSLTIANQRSECMRGFAMAIGSLVLFYVVGQVLLVMGQNGWLPSFIAGAFPSLLFTALGIFCVYKKQ